MQLGRMRGAWTRKTIGLALGLIASPALANPALVIDVGSGRVLYESQPTANWYPASLTKLMTVYVALHAVRDGRITMDTPFVVSSRAANMPPSKMGFKPGTQVTLDNGLKMLMVKSPNDLAVTIAEGVSGSVEAFADEMNAAAARLGLKESHFVNPNGLPDERQVSSARDMAMIARALLKEFPEENEIFGIGALQLGDEIIQTHNGLIGRYPGADGMKTGFTCAAGFNVVASATQGGRRLITVVLGSPSARERTAEAAALFDRGFAQAGGGLAGLFGGGGGGTLVQDLPSPGVNRAPDMHGEICLRRGRSAIAAGELEELSTPIAAPVAGGTRGLSMYTAAATANTHMTPLALAAMAPAHFDPVPVFIGPKPGWTGAVAAAREPDPAIQKAAASTAAGATATAYAPADKPAAAAEEAPPLAADTAPIALHAAVKPAAAKALIRKAAKPRMTKTAQLSKTRTRGLTAPAAAHRSEKDKTAAPAPTSTPTPTR
jgi:D-alanyl-D-alanine carboxypeptidase